MNQRANIYVKAHLVRKLLFEYKDTHTATLALPGQLKCSVTKINNKLMNTKKLRKLQNCMKEDSPTRTRNLRRKGLYFLFKR